MTQAFNLSQLANNLNTSGQLDATDGLTGTVPVANGGTGTSSPSLVGGTNITISGSWPNQTVTASGGGVTSLNGQTGAITNTGYGAIGSYVISFDTSMTGGANTVYNPDRTTAGSNLARYNGGTAGNAPVGINTGTSLWADNVTGLGLTGTWRQMTRVVNQSNFSCYPRSYGLALFVRIS